MGGHVFECNCCGRQQYSYHSCRNRHCPKCHKSETQAWLQGRQQELLAVPYHHVIFTLPHELGKFARLHQKEVYSTLIKTAAHSVIKLAADPHYVGGQVGIMAVLHTWGSNLSYHLHVHCLVTGGGLSEDGQKWLPARDGFLVPIRALSKLFRGLFLDHIRRQFPEVQLPDSLWRKDWVVYVKPAVHGVRTVLNYLARYIRRIAITNHRILAADNGQVRFRYKDYRTGQPRVMTLGAHEFIRRFLQHVLPSGLHKVRYYGLWSPSNRESLRKAQELLPQDKADEPAPLNEDAPMPPPATPRVCPYCREGILLWIGTLPRQGRAPPL